MLNDVVDRGGAGAGGLDAGRARAVASFEALQEILVGLPHLAGEGGHPILSRPVPGDRSPDLLRTGCFIFREPVRERTARPMRVPLYIEVEAKLERMRTDHHRDDLVFRL